MAEVTLRLQVDPATGKKTVTISYKSDESALPIEHEQEHRALVDKIIQGGALKAAEVGRIIVQREEQAAEEKQEQVLGTRRQAIAAKN